MKSAGYCGMEFFGCCVVLACSSSPGNGGKPGSLDPAGGAPSTEAIFADTNQADVTVPRSGRVYLKLSEASLVSPSAPADSNDWDLAFENFNVYTNSGPSGTGQAAAFGPIDLSLFASDSAPTVPFLSPDKTGGAFVDWYAYDDKSHALYSRFHVYGIQSGDRLWKLQLLSYYSERDNAPLSGLYQVRYAELGDETGATQTLQIDGTAGGVSGGANAGSGCLELATGTVRQIAPAEARLSTQWDLCFRRDSISVNGEVGGPGGVSAADLQADETSGEQLAAILKESADSTLSRFSGVTPASLEGVGLRGDHVVSAFETGVWLDADADAPARAAWLVREASGERQFLVAFSEFRNPTASSPGTVVVHIKPVKQ